MPLTPAPIDVLEALRPLFYRQRFPTNREQEIIVLAWDAIELVHSDGFETLLEQSKPLEVYGSALVAVGLPTAVPIFDAVRALVPGNPTDNADGFRSALHSNFDELKRLAEAFWDVCEDGDSVLRHFVSSHQAAFADFVSGDSAGA